MSATARARLAALVLVAAAAAAGACSGSSSSSGEATATTRPVTSLPLDIRGEVDLRRLVPSDAPAGYEILPAPPFGSVTLERLVSEFSDAPEEDLAVLREAGYRRGYTRGWLRESPRSFLGTFVFEFTDEAGARYARDEFAAQNAARKQATRFTVEGVDDAFGETYQQASEGSEPEVVHVITFVRGPRLYQVAGQYADPATPAEETVAFARDTDEVAG